MYQNRYHKWPVCARNQLYTHGMHPLAQTARVTTPFRDQQTSGNWGALFVGATHPTNGIIAWSSSELLWQSSKPNVLLAQRIERYDKRAPHLGKSATSKMTPYLRLIRGLNWACDLILSFRCVLDDLVLGRPITYSRHMHTRWRHMH